MSLASNEREYAGKKKVGTCYILTYSSLAHMYALHWFMDFVATFTAKIVRVDNVFYCTILPYISISLILSTSWHCYWRASKTRFFRHPVVDEMECGKATD